MFLQDFITQNIKDIRKFLPDFELSLLGSSNCYFCLVNEEVAGIWIGQKKDSTFEVSHEYVKDKFRDCGTGRYIYHTRRGYFRSEGIKIFRAVKIFGLHAEYMQKIGFKKTNTDGEYILDITG